VPVTLSCAAIAFPRAGEPEVRSIPTQEACEQWA
jgi:hypothetical protein